MAALRSTLLPMPLTVTGRLSTPQDSGSLPSSLGFYRSSGFQRVAVGHTQRAGMRHRITTPENRASSSSSSGVAETEDEKSALEGVKVYDPKGEIVSLVGLWENRPAVVAFTRHFGCVLCRKRADMLQSRKAEMDAAGVALVLIAPGSPEQAREFLQQTKFSGEVYADPDHASYDAFKFVNGPQSILTPGSVSKLAQAYSEGYRQDWKLSFYKDTVQRGGWQQGGILVAGPGANNVRYLFKDAKAGDEPELKDVMAACCSS